MKCARGYKVKRGKCSSKPKCIYKNIKKQISKGRLAIFTLILIILALIILPTGLDDVFTTIPLMFILGWKLYTVIAIIMLIICLVFYGKIIEFKNKAMRKC